MSTEKISPPEQNPEQSLEYLTGEMKKKCEEAYWALENVQNYASEYEKKTGKKLPSGSGLKFAQKDLREWIEELKK